MQSTCPNCGNPVASGDTFCRACGWHLGEESRALVVSPGRALVPYKLDRALLVGSATTLVLSAAWLGARWLAPRVAGSLANRLAAFAAPKEAKQRAIAATEAPPEEPRERFDVVWMRQIIWWRR